MNPLTLIPALYRKYVYAIYAFVGFVVALLEAVYAAFREDLGDTPLWVRITVFVVAFLAGPMGSLAASNVGPNDGPPPAPDH